MDTQATALMYFFDALLPVCAIMTAAFVCLEYVCTAPDHRFQKRAAQVSVFAVPVIIGCFSIQLNAAIFHFSGFTGHMVSVVLETLTFWAAPFAGTKYLCMKYTPRLAPQNP